MFGLTQFEFLIACLTVTIISVAFFSSILECVRLCLLAKKQNTP